MGVMAGWMEMGLSQTPAYHQKVDKKLCRTPIGVTAAPWRARREAKWQWMARQRERRRTAPRTARTHKEVGARK